jgi:hypothetical protein
MILPFSSVVLELRERRPPPRDTPQCGLEEIGERSVVASPLSRASLFGSAGKEADVASSGVVANAAFLR